MSIHEYRLERNNVPGVYRIGDEIHPFRDIDITRPYATTYEAFFPLETGQELPLLKFSIRAVRYGDTGRSITFHGQKGQLKEAGLVKPGGDSDSSNSIHRLELLSYKFLSNLGISFPTAKGNFIFRPDPGSLAFGEINYDRVIQKSGMASPLAIDFGEELDPLKRLGFIFVMLDGWRPESIPDVILDAFAPPLPRVLKQAKEIFDASGFS